MELDWQAIGIWFTGAALVVFVWLTWEIQRQQHRLIYGGPRLYIDYSETIVSQSNGQRSCWVHVQLENRAITAHSMVECTWDIYIPQGHMALPSQDCSNLKPAQLPNKVKGRFLTPPFRIEAFDTIEGWLHRCVPDKMLDNQPPEITLTLVDNTGRHYPISIATSYPIDKIEPHTH